MRRILLTVLLVLCAQAAFAQTRVTAARRSYLMPGDSIYAETALEAGDVLSWSLWLAEVPPAAGAVTLSIESSVSGEMDRRQFDGKEMNAGDEVRIPRAALYTVKLKTNGASGRLVQLGTWQKLSVGSSIPLPLPTPQKMNHAQTAGDKFAISFEFTLKDTISFARLLTLELPLDILTLKMITPVGDTLTAVPSVKRWIGEAGKFSLRDRAPRGGRITLRLETEAAESGDAMMLLASGAALPAWLPLQARMVTEHRHDPWNAVIVPPAVAIVDSLKLHPALPPQAQFAAQSLRAHGADAETVARLTPIFAERDSLAGTRRSRELANARPDTVFLMGKQAFLPPVLHAAFVSPLSLSKTGTGTRARATQIAWFAQTQSGGDSQSELLLWEYDEGRFALPAAPEEWFWDGTLLPLKSESKVFRATPASKPAVLTLAGALPARPATLEKNGVKLLDASQRVRGFYLSNRGAQMEYFIYRETHPIDRPIASGFKKWPKLAKIALILLGAFAVIGAWAMYELRQRERRRQKRAEEYARELENARQVQLKLLPNGPLEAEGLEIYGLHQSMQSVGGDYYDFFQLEDGRMIVCIADVTGHGMPAALLMANFQATLRAVMRTGKPLTEVVSLLNHDIYQRTAPEHFVTSLLAEISADRTMITYCNAGHNPGYVVRKNGNVEELDAGGIMLGALDMFPYIQMECGLNRGDVLAFYTDGIPEAEIGDEDMFGYDRLKHYLTENKDWPLTHIARSIFDRVTPGGATAIADDMAIVLVRVTR